MKIRQSVLASFALLLVLTSGLVVAQDKNSRAEADKEIALARSAAPKPISEAASVYVFSEGTYQLASKGTNGFTCLVLRDEDPRAQYPACLDAEWTRCELPEYMKEADLRKQGKSPDEIDATLDRMRREGHFPNPARSGIAYMASSQMRGMFEISPEGHIQPHVMIYAPGATNAQIGVAKVSEARVLHIPFVANEGKPNAHILSPLMSYTDGSRFEDAGDKRMRLSNAH